MKPHELRRLNRELTDYLDSMTTGMGRPERREAMSLYVTGLLLDGERKSIDPIAARLVDKATEREAMRQRLQQCVTISTWSDEEMRRRLAVKIDRELPELEAWVVDDTGFPKKGEHSVGVHRQYSGTLGRVDNCQVAVSLHLASDRGSACMAMQLYLPDVWCEDTKRRRKAGVPDEITMTTKWQMAVAQIDQALEWGLPRRIVLADAGYGDAVEFRDALVERRLRYVVGINSKHVVWRPGTGPIPPSELPPTRYPRTHYVTGDEKPVTVSELARSRGRTGCRTVHWREGSRGRQGSRFGALRIRTAHRHTRGAPPGDEQWLIYEWPTDESEPTKFWLSNLPASLSLKELVRMAKLRWRVERDYQELKQEIGLDHFEGRTWRGFHHHATLCAIAHGFLALRRALFPPEQTPVDAA